MDEHFFSNRSKDNLIGVHHEIISVIEKSLKLSPVRFEVTEGVRSKKTILQSLAKGEHINIHNKYLAGFVINIAAYPNELISWDRKHYLLISNIVKSVTEEFNVNIIWGGDNPELNEYTKFEYVV
ncbi:hypothetical protein GRAQ_00893 [Rahnella aquatilis CIP 78.65 = ATCC 33071]|uniref:Uncharacterized protein n=1 Tax=Rahnella aquatilis (strain ATCC 33071 / DSM 4594 / JCM 1683 / NBRC 105701 / NCIMB 13365 / CIP 78.65) TaxID=745277 RepID=H2IVE7_RAHAC|nr:hypothetical protein [Rahnella aquatilis]AEX51734.1 hypothetical protein Rahaq2_1868 [Rahnella aquatilis CIP 78.65 = ATCC 33071]KFD16153.1 hypothetical protein GRAQ_00893 [Rahnella aquatilis CIP 78.65 = ATCC 33071]